MNRRQFLRTVAVGGSTATLPAVGDGVGEPGSRPEGHRTPTATPTARATQTGTASPTATPTTAAATPTSGWEPLGRLAIPGATETVVMPDGETAFVAVGEGFASVDISDPTDPTVLTRMTDITPPDTDRVMAGIQDVDYDAGELLVAGPANYHPDAFRGVARFDVTDPAAPELRGAHETVFPVHNCYFEDGYAYLTGNDEERNPLVVVDVTEPAEVSRWSILDFEPEWADIPPILRSLHDVWVQDGLAYLAYWDAGTWILDVTDPSTPDYVGHVLDQSLATLRAKSGLAIQREYLEPPGNVHYATTNPAGSLLAVGKESWNSNAGLEGTTPGPDDPGGPSGVDIYDVTDPATPTHLATIDPPPTADPNIAGVWTTAHNVDLGDRYLYSAWYQGGLTVHDLADPAEPEAVRYFRRSSEASFWTARVAIPGETVVASSRFDPPDVPAGLYTFPDVPRETTPPTSATGKPTESTRFQTASPTPLDETSPPPSPDVTTDRSAGDGPGFGPLAALAGLGVGAWRFLGGTHDEPGDENP